MIRRAKRSDAGAIAAIYNYYIQHTVITFEESLLCGPDMVLRIDKVDGSGLPWLVAEENGDVVGYAYATPWNERSAYRHTVEISAYVARTSLSQGWGTRLYESLFEALRKSTVHVVIGGIALPNAASIALHEKFGMKKVAHFPQVGFKFGDWIDVGYWQVPLND